MKQVLLIYKLLQQKVKLKKAYFTLPFDSLGKVFYRKL